MARSTHLIAHVPALGGGLLALGVAVELLRRHHLVHHLLLLGGASLFRRSLQVRITLCYKIESGSVCFVIIFFFTSVIEAPSLDKGIRGVWEWGIRLGLRSILLVKSILTHVLEASAS